jgi:hypothetical protein
MDQYHKLVGYPTDIGYAWLVCWATCLATPGRFHEARALMDQVQKVGAAVELSSELGSSMWDSFPQARSRHDRVRVGLALIGVLKEQGDDDR